MLYLQAAVFAHHGRGVVLGTVKTGARLWSVTSGVERWERKRSVLISLSRASYWPFGGWTLKFMGVCLWSNKWRLWVMLNLYFKSMHNVIELYRNLITGWVARVFFCNVVMDLTSLSFWLQRGLIFSWRLLHCTPQLSKKSISCVRRLG